VRREAVRLQDGQQTREINIEVTPVSCRAAVRPVSWSCSRKRPRRPKRAGNTGAADQRRDTEEKDREIAQLRRDLVAAKDYLQSVIEQQDAANEELKSASEEILSATRNCRAPTRNWRPPRKSWSRPTKN